jgi:hypothetical protein
MEHVNPSPEIKASDLESAASTAEMQAEQRKILTGIIVIVLVVIGAIIVSIVGLARAPLDSVAKIRDIFIIFMALESLLIGLTLVILMVQMARLINLLQNEIKPILDSTNETVSNLRGTTNFLSDNLVQPVIKLNEYMAGFSELLKVIGLYRRRS